MWTIPPHVCLSRPSIKDPSIYCRKRDRFRSNSSIYFCVPAHFIVRLAGIITASVKVNRSCRCARLSFSKNDPYIYMIFQKPFCTPRCKIFFIIFDQAHICHKLHYFITLDNICPYLLSILSLYQLDFLHLSSIYKMQILHSYYFPCILMSVWTDSILWKVGHQDSIDLALKAYFIICCLLPDSHPLFPPAICPVIRKTHNSHRYLRR